MQQGSGLSAHHTGDAQGKQSERNDSQNGVDMFVCYSHLAAKVIKKMIK